MLTSKYSQKNSLSHKPFASIRFIVDPLEGLKTLDLKLKKPTLFIEVIHGDENGVLNKQWIPLPLQHDPKIPVEQKTHYGQKTVTSKQPNIPATFDTKAITDFIFPRIQKNKNVPFILPGSGQTIGKNLTLCIPTSSGECQLGFTSDGNIGINRVPSDLDLKIETHGNIKIGSNLQCRAAHLIAKNIENRHSLSADTIQLDAQKKITNAGNVTGKQSLTVTAEDLENSQTGQILGDNIHIIGDTALDNSGQVKAQKKLEINTKTNLINQKTGTLKSGEILDINAQSVINSGEIKSTQNLLVQTQEILENQASGRIAAKKAVELSSKTVVQNSGKIDSLGLVKCEADKIIQDQKESKIISAKKLTLLARSTIDNSGVMFGKHTTKLTASEALTNKTGATLGSDGTLNIDNTRHINNFGSMVGKARFDIATPTCLNNATTGLLTSDLHLELALSAQSKNYGELSAKTLILSAEDLENSASGKISGENISFIGNTVLDNSGHVTATKKLSLQAETVLTNQTTGILESGELLDLDISGLKNYGKIKSTEKLVLKAKTVVNNLGTMKGSSIDMTIASYNQPSYSFFNSGEITAENGDFTFTGQGISHTDGSIKSNQSISITAININLPAETTAVQNIALYYGGGIWFVKEAVKATGELSFNFPEGYTVTEERTVPGSLKYALSLSATKPLLFLANQTAKNGTLKIETPTPASVGSDSQFVSLLASGKLETTASHFTLINGRVLGGAVQLSTKSHILLGRAGKYCLIASVGEMEFSAPGNMVWDHLDLTCGTDLTAKTASLDDMSSRLHVVGNAIMEIPNSRHRLLTEYKANGYNIPWRDWDKAFHSYKTIGPSEQPLTAPAKFTVGGTLKLTGQTEIFGSQVSCGSIEGVRPKVAHFFPYIAFRRAYFCGHKKYRKCHWEYIPSPWSFEYQAGNPLYATLSIGGHLQLSQGALDVRGIISAVSISLDNIENTALIGQSFDLILRLPPPKPFRSRIPLMEYATKATMLYDIKEEGFPSVYQPVIPLNLVGPLGPIIVVGSGGFLRPNIENRRCLFAPLQERELLVEAMMDGLGRGFLAPGLTDSQKILAFLRENAEQYMQDKKTGLVSQEGTRSLPMMVYQEIEFIHASGKKEMVLVPDFCIPKTMDNSRLRDGAGGLFALGGDILLRGANQANSTLQISGHIDAKGKVIFSQFNTLTESKRTVKEIITVVDTNTTKSCFGLVKKTHQTEKSIEIIHIEPGNTVSASEVVYENITNVQWQGLQMAVGEGGVKTHNVHAIEERVVVAKTIQTVENNQRNLLGSMSSTTHVVQSALHPSTIQSLGPINLSTHVGTYDTLQVVSNQGVQITAQHLSFHVYLKQLEETRRLYEAQMEDAKRHSKNQQKRMLIKMIAGTVVGAIFAPMLAQSLLATVGTTGIFASKTTLEAAYIVTRGAIFGGIRSSISGTNPLKGSIQGGIFAGVGFAVENMLSSVETLKELETLRDAIQTTAIASLDTTLNGGNLVENVLASVAADFVANKVVGKPDGTIVKQVTRSLVETAMISTMTNSTTLGPNLIASGLGSLAQGVGSRYGQRLVSTVTVNSPKSQKLPQNPPLIFSQMKLSQSTPRDSSSLNDPYTHFLEIATKETSQVLARNGIHVSDANIKNVIKAHPVLQGSPNSIKAKLIKLGRSVGGARNNNSALVKGLEKVFDSTLTILSRLVGINEVYAANLDPISDRGMLVFKPGEDKKYFLSRVLLEDMRKNGNLHVSEQKPGQQLKIPSKQRQRFQLPSVLPESSPDTFLNNSYAVGRGIELGRNNVLDTILHPFSTVQDMAATIWDGYNEISDVTFGLSTEGSRIRNIERGRAITYELDRFRHGNSATKIEMISELVSGGILGTAILSSVSAITRSNILSSELKPIGQASVGQKGFGQTGFEIYKNKERKIFNIRNSNKVKNYGSGCPQEPLRMDKDGRMVVDPGVEGAYTQLGIAVSKKNGRIKYQYSQAREFDANGKPVRDIDFTDHNRSDLHTNPHQHKWVENETGGSLKRGIPVPLESDDLLKLKIFYK